MRINIVEQASNLFYVDNHSASIEFVWHYLQVLVIYYVGSNNVDA